MQQRSVTVNSSNSGEFVLFGVVIKPGGGGEEVNKGICSAPLKKKQRTDDGDDNLTNGGHEIKNPPKGNSDHGLHDDGGFVLFGVRIKTGEQNKPVSGGVGGGSTSTSTSSTTTTQENQALSPEPLAVDPLNAIEWTIKKRLTWSDCNEGQCRLLIPKKSVSHILNYLDDEEKARVDSESGLPIRVRDCDIIGGHEVELILKRWNSTNATVLHSNWVSGFVDRRDLVKGMEIGLAWDQLNHKLLFSVLRAA